MGELGDVSYGILKLADANFKIPESELGKIGEQIEFFGQKLDFWKSVCTSSQDLYINSLLFWYSNITIQAKQQQESQITIAILI